MPSVMVSGSPAANTTSLDNELVRDTSGGREGRPALLACMSMLRRDRLALAGLIILVLMVGGALLAPVLSPYGVDEIDRTQLLTGPSPSHLLGTDELGRDLLTRVLWGGRVSLGVGVTVTLLSVLCGVLIGVVAGYYQGPVDFVLGRVVDILLAFPGLILALALLSALGQDTSNLILALTVGGVAAFVRLMRGVTLSVAAELYVESARVAGAGALRIIGRYILPNCFAPVLVSATGTLGLIILAEATLSFLGLGVRPPTPSWGLMLSTGRSYLQSSPWVSLWPGLAVFLAVLSFNLLGDGIRDATDPRLTTVNG